MRDAGARDEQGAVHDPREDRRVAHDVDGRGVEQQPVVAGAQLGHEVGEGGRAQLLRGVRRDGAAAQHVQALGHGHDGLVQRRLADEHLAQADLVGQVEDLVHARAAQVGVDDQHPLARGGEHRAQVGGHRGLAFGDPRAGDQDGLEVFVGPREQQVRAQGAEALGHHGPRVVQDVHVGVAEPLGRPTARARGRSLGLDQGDDAEHRDAEALLQVRAAADGVIELIEAEHGDDAEEQAEHHAERQVRRRLGPRGVARGQRAAVPEEVGRLELAAQGGVHQPVVDQLRHPALGLQLALDAVVLALQPGDLDRRRGGLLEALLEHPLGAARVSQLGLQRRDDALHLSRRAAPGVGEPGPQVDEVRVLVEQLRRQLRLLALQLEQARAQVRQHGVVGDARRGLALLVGEEGLDLLPLGREADALDLGVGLRAREVRDALQPRVRAVLDRGREELVLAAEVEQLVLGPLHLGAEAALLLAQPAGRAHARGLAFLDRPLDVLVRHRVGEVGRAHPIVVRDRDLHHLGLVDRHHPRVAQQQGGGPVAAALHRGLLRRAGLRRRQEGRVVGQTEAIHHALHDGPAVDDVELGLEVVAVVVEVAAGVLEPEALLLVSQDAGRFGTDEDRGRGLEGRRLQRRQGRDAGDGQDRHQDHQPPAVHHDAEVVDPAIGLVADRRRGRGLGALASGDRLQLRVQGDSGLSDAAEVEPPTHPARRGCYYRRGRLTARIERVARAARWVHFPCLAPAFFGSTPVQRGGPRGRRQVRKLTGPPDRRGLPSPPCRGSR